MEEKGRACVIAMVPRWEGGLQIPCAPSCLQSKKVSEAMNGASEAKTVKLEVQQKMITDQLAKIKESQPMTPKLKNVVVCLRGSCGSHRIRGQHIIARRRVT